MRSPRFAVALSRNRSDAGSITNRNSLSTGSSTGCVRALECGFPIPWRPPAPGRRSPNLDFPQPKSSAVGTLWKSSCWTPVLTGTAPLGLTCAWITRTVNRLSHVLPRPVLPRGGHDMPALLLRIVFLHQPTWSSSEQAHVPAEQPPAGEGPRLPRADEYPRRPRRAGRPPPQGPPAARCLNSGLARDR